MKGCVQWNPVYEGVVWWCDGAGSTSSAGASCSLDTVGQGPIALAVGAGWGCLDIFTLVYPFSPLSPPLWETARYRLKYCLRGPLNPKQPTNRLRLERSSPQAAARSVGQILTH